MFKLSFFFVKILSIESFLLKASLCMFYNHLFICVLPLKIQLSRMGELEIPLTGLTLPQLCACLKPAHESPTLVSYAVVCFLSSMIWGKKWILVFVNIGGIVDHHCLNFLFKKCWIFFLFRNSNAIVCN